MNKAKDKSPLLAPSSDLNAYNAAQARLKAILGLHGIGAISSPDYQTAWQEIETIKNRHGGMPPTATNG